MADLFHEFEAFGRTSHHGVSDRGLSEPNAAISDNPFDDLDVQSTSSIKQNEKIQVRKKATEQPILKHSDTSRIRLPSGHITHLVVTSNIATICCLGNSIFRYNLNLDTTADTCEIKREENDRIHKIFQDPKAHHLLVCMSSKETYYIPRGGAKKPQPRLLPRLKGYLIESIAWNNEEGNEQSTGAILFGTNEGMICETIIDALEKRRPYCIEVHELMQDLKGQVEQVQGMHMQQFPSEPGKWYVLATTSSRVYQFIGNATKGEVQFQEMFNVYKDYSKVQFQEIPGVLKDSKHCLWPQKPGRVPSSFAWLTGAGVYYSTLAFKGQEPGESLFYEKNLIPYSAANESGDDKDSAKVEVNQKDTAAPIGLALTEFHCVLLFRERIVAICHLNNKKVFEESFNVRRHGPLTGMCTDPNNGNIWTWAKMVLQAYYPFKETRNLWKIYLEQKKFHLAEKYAEGNQESLDTILVKQAEYHFKEEKYEAAAEYFSRSNLSFEEVALKFLQVDKREALKRFVHIKLSSLDDQSKTQRTMLTIWLIEMHLNELGTAKDANKMDEYLDIQREFHGFLENGSLRDCLYHNSGTIYDLMLSHGATEDVIFFAKLMEDYERVIEHHIQQYNYEGALETLKDRSAAALKDPDKSNRRAKFQKLSILYYKFSPVLVKHIPGDTVDAWISCERYLTPKKLIPSLIQCDQADNGHVDLREKQNAAAIKYLEFCVNQLRSEEPSVHNFLVSSYANSTAPEDHQKLKKYLIKQADSPTPCYDTQYALRTCLERDLSEACVYIYSAMSLFEECVSLALKCGNVDLARSMVSYNITIRRDELLQKKLWLKIAEYLIRKEKDIKKAMQFLKDCELLKIEDILPFFEDVVTIDQFKDAICDSLQSYNSHIDNLKKEMDTATTSAKNIRSDIQEIRNKCVLIKSNQKCAACDGRLLLQSFYMFPCRHSFHQDCLVKEIASIKLAGKGKIIKNTNDTELLKEYVKDDEIGTDCPYCGIAMIASVSIPLVTMETLHEDITRWWH